MTVNSSEAMGQADRPTALATQLAGLPVYQKSDADTSDWLVSPPKTKAAVYRREGKNEIVLSNGLLRRVFRLTPNAATVALDHEGTGVSYLRAVKPEALLTLNGKVVPVGGLTGQPNLAFLQPEWLDQMTADPSAFQFTGFHVGKTEDRFPWKRVRHAADLPWPPTGVSLTLAFAVPDGPLAGLTAEVHYELYDGLPLLAKWVTLRNGTAAPVKQDRFVAETLGVVEAESLSERSERWELPNLTVVTDYSFGGMAANNSNRTVYWETDPAYSTQVNYELKTPCLLEVRPPLGPGVEVAPGASFSTFRVPHLRTAPRQHRPRTARAGNPQVVPHARALVHGKPADAAPHFHEGRGGEAGHRPVCGSRLRDGDL